MANNPYLEDNPYLNGYNFDSEETTPSAQNQNYQNPYASNGFLNAQSYNYNAQQEPVQQQRPEPAQRAKSKNNKEVDILDASTYINAEPTVKEDDGKPYKEIKHKNDKPKTIKIKEKKRFSFKSFFLGIILAVAVMVTSLGFTIITLVNTITLGKVQTWLNISISDGDINDYTIKDLIGLVQGYNTITIGNIKS